MYIRRLMLSEKFLLKNFRNENLWFFVINLCLALILAYTLASLTWKIADPEGRVRNENLSSEVQLAPSFSINQGAKDITQEADLFGKAGRVETSPVPLDQRSLSAPPTSLSLILKGIIAAEPMSRALAAIAEKKNTREKLYGVGDKVPGNAVVSEIHTDRVILLRSGVLETLMLIDKKSNSSDKATRRFSSAGGKKITSLGDGIHWQIDNSYLKQRLSDIPALAREVGVEIYKENNVQKGYRLVSARGSKLLRDMGLQPGDILNEVNGVPLNSVHDGLSAYQNLRTAKEVRVVITRNGRRETKIYAINNGG